MSAKQTIRIVKKHKRGINPVKDIGFQTNERIIVPKVVVIDENGENLGEMSRNEALALSRQKELDLVLVSPTALVPVARIVDWSKFKYEREKRLRKNTNRSMETKEWWFNITIGERDMLLKLNKVKEFLQKGGVAKITVKSVQKANPDQVDLTLKKLINHLNEFSSPLSELSREGRSFNITVKLKK